LKLLIILSHTIFTKIPIANGYINAKIAYILLRKLDEKQKIRWKKKTVTKKIKC
jgi:hypothetical protein